MSDDDKEPVSSEFLRDLAERLRGVPVMYGVDDGDIDTLGSIAGDLDHPRRACDFRPLDSYKKTVEKPGQPMTWIRVDRFYCCKCLKQSENVLETASPTQPEWW